jgi:hypothetical protein
MGVNIKAWSAEIIRGILTIFTDQPILFSEKCIPFWHQNFFNSIPHSLTNLNENAQFKVALTRYLNAQSFHSLDEFFVCR